MLIILATKASGILDAPPARGMTIERDELG
jgi:hypothetical protein